ncbi:hypothetical protein DWB77_07457 [Streptomyces hundungensis]|uniref:Uncharacterized protein n=1 Tax=Streptomyces hundungensis TaxID=1077946 RepID=A0A387HSJ7_9ACTN|nr:hypothetical protein [Streptomyces hundungensis]AYG85240.1 hypothetical protein DWB77_07457 [Streptomyces hundungensis]
MCRAPASGEIALHVASHLRARMGLDRRECLGFVRGPEELDRVPEKFGFHRWQGSHQGFDEVKGQAVVVERLADGVQI